MLRPSPSRDAVLATLFGVDLRLVLSDYEVTTVPHPRASLTLVWSEPVTDEDEPLPTFGGALAVVDDYRITRVPKAS